MKRIFSMLVFGVGGVAILGGCPVYGGDGGPESVACSTSRDCPTGSVCAVTGFCATPAPGNCAVPTDCSAGNTCGSDSLCHAGDCSTWPCVSGFVCKVSSGSASCVAGTVTDAGPPDSGFSGCTSNASCASAGAGAKCLNGACVAPADQCSDATQCSNAYQCVEGVCTPACSVSKPCPTGYACDTGKGVCTGNPSPCASSAQCTGGTVCVEQHCVAPCNQNSCASGSVCVAGGCIPDQKPQFVCATEGKQDACTQGSLCLHHNCYIACSGSTDAGVQCKNTDQFNLCKAVVTGSGTYNVCGSSSNLGSECDPTIAKNCGGGLICIDGFCR